MAGFPARTPGRECFKKLAAYLNHDPTYRPRILISACGPTGEWLGVVFSQDRYDVESSTNGKDCDRILRQGRVDLVIADIFPEHPDGLAVIEAVSKVTPKIPVIVLTNGEDTGRLSGAVRSEVFDFLDKPVNLFRLQASVARALNIDSHELGRHHGKYCRIERREIDSTIVGRSQGIREVQNIVMAVSPGRSNLLIEGEYGTGKRLVSRVVHNAGATFRHPFVAVDINALPEPLLETVLFGDVAGARNGRGRKGLFELAGAGTLFLSEISEIPRRVQEKLLRVMVNKEFRPVGGEEAIPVKARIIGVSTRNLRGLVGAGEFREDLYYRIAPCTITLPPLRQRKEDIPLLLIHLVRRINRRLHRDVRRVPSEVVNILKGWDWPGNVAELEGVIVRSVLSVQADVLEPELLLRQINRRTSRQEEPDKLDLDTVKKEHIKSVLDETNWDKREAARLLNISRQALYNKIKKYGIVPY